MTDQTVRVPHHLLSEAAGLLDCEGYGPISSQLNALIAAAPSPEAEKKPGDLHTQIMDLIHSDLMRQNPDAFAEEDGNSTIAIPVAKAFLTIDVSALAESVLASLQRPQTPPMLPGVETLGHSAAFGANVRTDSGLVDRLVEALERIATVDMGGGFLGALACRQVAQEALDGFDR